MGRPLRSGRVVKSLSPDKDRTAQTPAKKTPAKAAPKAAAKAAPKAAAKPPPKPKAPAKAAVKAAPAKSAAKGGKSTPAKSAKAAPKRRQAKEETDSEEEVAKQDSDSKEESGSSDDSSDSKEKEEVSAPKVKITPKATPGKKKVESEESEEESSGSEDESEDEKAPAKKSKTSLKKKGKSPKKEVEKEKEVAEDDDSEESSSEEEVEKVAPAPLKKAKSPAKQKQESSDESGSEEDSSDEDEVKKVAPTPLRNAKSPAKQKQESSDESGSEEESSDEDEVKEVAPPPLRKAKSPAKQKQESSDESGSEEESSDEDEVKKVAPTPLRKAKSPAKQKQESSDESEEESSEDKAEKVAPTPLKKAKSPAKQNSSDEEDSEEESSDEDEVKKVAPTPLKKAKSPAKQNSSDEKASDDDSADGSDEESEGDDRRDKGFTDENAAWLKPKSKMTLMSSDEEDDEFAQESDEEDENMLEVERQSRLIDAEMAQEEREAEMELRRTIAQETSVFHLPTPEELQEDENRVVPPSELRARIEDILEVLADFKVRREPGRSRSEYIDRLAKDMAELFGYLQELVDYFLSMFGPNECFEFLEASDKPRPLVVRVNTLKARRKDLAAALMKRGVRLDPLAPWSKVGLKIYESTVPIGATPEYLAGHYMLQSAASMCPVMALGPQPGDRVMDMSAAPGGKTSYLSQLMKNKGVVIANDLKAERQKATVANLHRLGVRNVVTCCYDGRKIGGQLRNQFDRILLDAPCSGLGVISRDPSVKVQRTIPDVKRCAHLQKELLLAAVDALNHKSKKGGGYMVYSTCSVAVAENEEVVNYLMSKRDVKLVETGLDFGKPGFTRFEHKRFHPSLALTRRFYPHVHNMDGFYVAKIQKLSDKRKGEDDKKQVAEEGVTNEEEVALATDVKKGAVVVEDDTQKSKNKKKQKGKKRAIESKDGDDESKPQGKRSKNSYPPVQPQQKKKRTNAKVSKPRRVKVNGM